MAQTFIVTYKPVEQNSMHDPITYGASYEKTYVVHHGDPELRRLIKEEVSGWKSMTDCRLVNPDNPEWSKPYDPYASGKDYYVSPEEEETRARAQRMVDAVDKKMLDGDHVAPYTLRTKAGEKKAKTVGELLGHIRETRYLHMNSQDFSETPDTYRIEIGFCVEFEADKFQFQIVVVGEDKDDLCGRVSLVLEDYAHSPYKVRFTPHALFRYELELDKFIAYSLSKNETFI